MKGNPGGIHSFPLTTLPKTVKENVIIAFYIQQDLKPGDDVGTREIFVHNYSNAAENFCFKYNEYIQALR